MKSHRLAIPDTGKRRVTEPSGVIDKSLLSRYPNKISWDLNLLCNFDCTYCFYDRSKRTTELDGVGKYSPQFIRECFDRTQKEWLILISGGEPFLYPDFVQLIQELTKRHHIQLTSNLSTKNVYEFADTISPEHVMAISASLHIEFREKTRNGYADFINKCLYLQEKGFALLVNYVTYPSLFDRLQSDIARLKAEGVEQVTVLTFRGEYQGQTYPDAYTPDQLALIREFATDDFENNIATRDTCFYGRPCEAGQSYFKLDQLGNLSRCLTIWGESYGNLFSGEYRFNDVPTPCSAKECHDCYVGYSVVNPR